MGVLISEGFRRAGAVVPTPARGDQFDGGANAAGREGAGAKVEDLTMNTFRNGVKYETYTDLITKAMKLPVVFIALAVLASPASAYKIVCNPAVTANCSVDQRQAPRPRPSEPTKGNGLPRPNLRPALPRLDPRSDHLPALPMSRFELAYADLDSVS